jgi:hypothetical protein
MRSRKISAPFPSAMNNSYFTVLMKHPPISSLDTKIIPTTKPNLEDVQNRFAAPANGEVC